MVVVNVVVVIVVVVVVVVVVFVVVVVVIVAVVVVIVVVVVDDDDDVSWSDSIVDDDLMCSELADHVVSIDDMYTYRLCGIIVVSKFLEARSEQLLEK